MSDEQYNLIGITLILVLATIVFAILAIYGRASVGWFMFTGVSAIFFLGAARVE